jgi:hypothetical protein
MAEENNNANDFENWLLVRHNMSINDYNSLESDRAFKLECQYERHLQYKE